MEEQILEILKNENKALSVHELEDKLGFTTVDELKELLKTFGSLKKMKEASVEDLEKILNKEIAKNLFSYLKEL